MHLVVATEEQKRTRDRLTWSAWGAKLDEEAYCRRETRLRAHPFAREGMQTWLWTDGGGEILASCETFRMRSRLGGAIGVSFGVASVFTEPRLRRSGHALAMMRALGARLREMPGAQAAILFSEVGATLYRRAGFSPRTCHDRVFPAGGPAPVGAVLFGEEALGTWLPRLPEPAGSFAILPTAAQIDWHLERARFYAAELRRDLPPCGAAIDGAIAIFAADFKNERLAVLAAHAPDASSALGLVAAARHAAARADLAEVRFWETPSLPLPPDAGTRMARDGDALPMLLPLVDGLRADEWIDIPRALWV